MGISAYRYLKKFPFPEIEGMKFIPESMVWSQIARHYKTRFINEVLGIDFIDDPNSLSTSRKILHPLDLVLRYQSMINDEFDYFRTLCYNLLKYFLIMGDFLSIAKNHLEIQ